MGRKKKSKRTKNIFYCDGINFRGQKEFEDLGDGLFTYDGYIYDVADFGNHKGVINVDKSDVLPISGLVAPKIVQKKKGKKQTSSLMAYSYSNIEDCQDVKQLQET